MKPIEAEWLTTKATKAVFELLSDFQTYAVGGCVRNTLLGVKVKDIDLSTSAHPDVVIELAKAAGLKAVPTGIDHGTVTVVVEDTPFEITTFRKDVKTDGRRAVVAFSTSIEEDARRRDFTINAIYADASGHLYDPVLGLPDIATRYVRFIEDAERRIQEDYLRSLRFFRFNAWYGDPNNGFDPEALNAIGRNIPGLETLSRERVGAELLKLLDAPDPTIAVAGMRSTGVLAAILPGSDDTALGPLVSFEQSADVSPNCLRRLAVLGGSIKDLRLSRSQLAGIEKVRSNVGADPRVVGYREGSKIGRDVILLTAALLGQQFQSEMLTEVEQGASSIFPVSAKDLMPELEGKALGEELRTLEDRWIKSGFTLSREELLRRA